MSSQLRYLICRGDRVSIKQGRLRIEAASEKEPPQDWLDQHSAALVNEILEATGVKAWQYDSYTTGNYGRHKAAGVTIQFVAALSEAEAYVVFNAELKRTRGERKGKPLPQGQFRVGKRSHFYKFWLRTGLKTPDRLSKFYDYMGNLRGVLFSGVVRNRRLDAGTLGPLDVSSDLIRQALFPNNVRTIAAQHPHNSRTNMPHKEYPQKQAQQGVAPFLSTGNSNYGNKVTRDTGARENGSHTIDPREQSHEDWIADYNSGS